VDDMTGELAGHAIERLIEAGALDAWVAPLTMKKGRPGLMMSALCEAEASDRITEVLLRETTTLGVRRVVADRTARPRRSIMVETDYGVISVKVSEGPFGPAQVKPEFADCARAARDAGVPVRQVIDAAHRAALALGRL
jgi:uncharacterized protein (DUF111 family)